MQNNEQTNNVPAQRKTRRTLLIINTVVKIVLTTLHTLAQLTNEYIPFVSVYRTKRREANTRRFTGIALIARKDRPGIAAVNNETAKNRIIESENVFSQLSWKTVPETRLFSFIYINDPMMYVCMCAYVRALFVGVSCEP